MSRSRLFHSLSPRRHAWLLTALGLGGCRTPEQAPPFTGPQPIASIRYFKGSPLSGPQAGPGAVKSEDLCPFCISVVALESWAPESREGQALGTQVRLLAVPRGESPVKPIPRLTAPARIATASGDDSAGGRLESGQLGRTAPISTNVRGLLPRGVTAVFELKSRLPDGGLVELHVHRPTAGSNAKDEIQAALVLAGRLEDTGVEDAQDSKGTATTGSTPPQQPEVERELALLDPMPAREARSIVLFVPSPFHGEPGEGIAFLLATGPAGLHDTDAASQDPGVARALAELEKAGVSPVTAESPPPTPFASSLAQTLQALASPPTRRTGLLLLAQDSGAALTEDLALTADFDALNATCELLLRKPDLQRVAGIEPSLDRPRIAFLLEATSLEHLTGLLSKESLPGELQGVLVKHAGQAGRQISSLEEALRTSKNVEELRARIADENWIALEDSSPPARVRAYDWLLAQRDAPEGFDPLAPAKTRRAALKKSLESRASPPPPRGSSPGPPTEEPLRPEVRHE